ncbi:hypothetical protein LINPERHAP1_LOCUS21194, partial [Linum perenne]
KRSIEVAWQATPGDCITLNYDGSVLGPRGRAAFGGLLQDKNDNCLLAYTMNLGVSSITRAEIRGALVRLAWRSGYGRVEIQLDPMVVVVIFTDASSTISHHHAL